MTHMRFKGTHYQIGYKWGAMLRKRGISLLEATPFSIDEKRLDFAQGCLPHYQKHAPEIVEEINGIAEGHGCDKARLMGMLFSMYSIDPCNHCSCFVVAGQDDKVLLGRNSDFLTDIEELNMNALYRFTDDGYAFNGNTTAFVEMEDGINEHGFAIGLTSVAPEKTAFGLNVGMLLRLFLERCKTVDEMLLMLKELPLACSFTLVAADAMGGGVLVEASPAGVETVSINKEKRYVCSTNMFNTAKMSPHNNLPEDTWDAEARYATMENYLSRHGREMDVEKAMALLAGKEGMMCQYDRGQGRDTVWSVVYEMQSGGIYRVEGNPGRKAFKKDERTWP